MTAYTLSVWEGNVFSLSVHRWSPDLGLDKPPPHPLRPGTGQGPPHRPWDWTGPSPPDLGLDRAPPVDMALDRYPPLDLGLDRGPPPLQQRGLYSMGVTPLAVTLEVFLVKVYALVYRKYHTVSSI